MPLLKHGHGSMNFESSHGVEIPTRQSFLIALKHNFKETLFPDDPFREFKKQPPCRRLLFALRYFLPIIEWAPQYGFSLLKSDLLAGITIASLAIPQGISYAKLASLPPVLGLYSSFIPPIIYALMGSSKELAVGNVAVPSLLISSIIGKEVNPKENPTLYLHLALTATFFAGVFQASLGLLRLGFMVDFLSHATIVGFMAGAATVVSLQQLKGVLGLDHFTHSTDIVSVMRSVFSQTQRWKWESALMGCCFLIFLFSAKFFGKKRPSFFWVSAMAPLVAVVLGSLIAYFAHAEHHGIEVIGHLEKGLNPPSYNDLVFESPHLTFAVKTGIIIGIISLAEGIAVGRSFAMFRSYHIDGNKEMVAIGTMNIIGSCFSCYLTTGPFARSAVNFNAGCKTATSNVVMALVVMVTLLFLTPLFYYTPLVVLSSIIISAMMGLIDYNAAIHLWNIDKFDFMVCLSAYIGTVFSSVVTGLITAVSISLLRVLLFVSRPRTFLLGNVPNTAAYQSIEQYPNARTLKGIVALKINSAIYFTNSSYLREKIMQSIEDEECKLKGSEENFRVQYVILDMGAVGNIDTSGISMLQEVHKIIELRGFKLVLANPGGEVMKKLHRSKLSEKLGQEWIFLTVEQAVSACGYLLATPKPSPPSNISACDLYV